VLKIRIITLGKYKEQGFISLEKEYLKRLSSFAKVVIDELPEIGYGKNANTDQIKEKEARLIEARLPKGAIVILLEEKGSLRTSKELASFVGRLSSLGQELVFVLGSGLGLHESLRKVSNYQLSLSPLTFTHNFARVLLLEQLYRSFMIDAQRPYHK
jgi:23S rRNA (pseudouridine1915-N3)-methyltransferase